MKCLEFMRPVIGCCSKTFFISDGDKVIVVGTGYQWGIIHCFQLNPKYFLHLEIFDPDRNFVLTNSICNEFIIGCKKWFHHIYLWIFSTLYLNLYHTTSLVIITLLYIILVGVTFSNFNIFSSQAMFLTKLFSILKYRGENEFICSVYYSTYVNVALLTKYVCVDSTESI